MKSVTRRNLFQSAAVLPLAAVRGSAANSAVKVGLIGAGGRGTFDAGHVVNNPNARLTAVCDIFDDKLRAIQSKLPIKDAKTYKNLNDLLASDVDAVVIATPVYLHPEHFEAAVKAGKHIYIEKPAGLDAAGCRRVIRAADGADRKLNITFGFQQRYAPVYLNAKKLLDSGAIGPIRMAHAHWIKGAVPDNQKVLPKPTTEEAKIREWHVWKDTFGDIIVETYVHGIDVLNWFLGGHPTRAFGCGGRTVEKRGDIMDHCEVTFDYAANVQAVLTGSQIAPSWYRSVNEQFFCAKGVIETAREYWTHYKGKGEAVTEKSAREITIDSLETFVRNIQNNTPHNTAVESAESTLTAIMGRMAMDAGRAVTWEEVMKS